MVKPALTHEPVGKVMVTVQTAIKGTQHVVKPVLTQKPVEKVMVTVQTGSSYMLLYWSGCMGYGL